MFGICVCMMMVACVLIVFARTIFYKVRDSIIKAKYTPQWKKYREECEDKNNTYSKEYCYFDAYVRNIKNIEDYNDHFLIDDDVVKGHAIAFSIIFIITAIITPISISTKREDNDIKYEVYEQLYPSYQSLVDTADKAELFKLQGYQDIQEYNTEITKNKAKQNKFWYRIYYSDKHDWNNLNIISFE